MQLQLIDNLLIFTFSMMYSGVCPIATVICFLFFVFSSYMDEKLLTFWFQRCYEPNNIGMTVWTQFVELIIFVIVIMNTVIVWVVSPSFRGMIAEIDE